MGAVAAIKRAMSKAGRVVLVRHKPGQHVGGKFKPGKRSEYVITASVQPLTSREMQFDETLRRIKATHKIYTDMELLVSDDTTGQVADVICWAGREYEVQEVFRYDHLNLEHWKAVARLRNK